MGQLQDKVAVITGGTRGLGLAISRAYAAEGAAVVLASRSHEAVEKAVAGLVDSGAKASGLALDAGDLAGMQALAEQALRDFGRIDIWVNNAGTAGPYGPTVEIDPQSFEQVVRTNILGVYYGSLIALQHMLPKRSGKLINLLGHGYRSIVPYQSAYASSKAWVRAFTLALAKENQDSGVSIFAFNPGLVLTELITDIEVVEGSEDKLERFPMVVRMLAKPPEVPAQKAVWLASSSTDGKTGEIVSVSNPATMLGRMFLGMFQRDKAPVNLQVTPIPRYRG